YFFYAYSNLRSSHSFPTRRSSDLIGLLAPPVRCCAAGESRFDLKLTFISSGGKPIFQDRLVLHRVEFGDFAKVHYHCFTVRLLRSEEHTSELQSRSDLVCRLLLEK